MVWRTYASGKRTLCGVELPEGMKENDDCFPSPIITPSTKAEEGHDEDISAEKSLQKTWLRKKNGITSVIMHLNYLPGEKKLQLSKA